VKRATAITYALICLTALMLASGEVCAQENTTAAFTRFKMPQYDDQGKLKFIIYGSSGHMAGVNIFLNDLLVDLLENNIKDIDEVMDLDKVEIYDIDEDTIKIIEFWSRLPHTQALIYSLDAVYNRTSQTLNSDKKLKFRSRFVDVDGVGFDGSYFSGELHIRSKVKMIIRSGFMDKSKNDKKVKKQ
jgi:hypothetical protein